MQGILSCRGMKVKSKYKEKKCGKKAGQNSVPLRLEIDFFLEYIIIMII